MRKSRMNFKKYISSFLILILIVSTLPRVDIVQAEEVSGESYNYILDENGEIQLSEDFKEDIEIVKDNDEIAIIETNLEVEDNELNINAALNKEEDTITVISTENADTNNEVKKEYKVEISEATEDVFIATFTDIETGEQYVVDNTKTKASAVVLPIAVVLGGALVSHLIAISAAMVIAGVTYYVATKVISRLKRSDPYHYMAKLRSGKLWIGNSVSQSRAAAHLRAGGDIWSRSNSLAWTVANKAGKYTPTKAEVHGNGGSYFYHFHAQDAHNKRVGGHSFF